MTGQTVLIADGSLTVRMEVAEAFAATGFAATPCATIAEARAALDHRTFDVAVLDLVLPDGDSVDILAEIRAAPQGVRTVVLMSCTDTEAGDRVAVPGGGADKYVWKPYDVGEMVAAARELLGARRPAERGVTTILVIDDSMTVREELRRVLEQRGYAVVTAESGEDGLKAAATGRIGAMVVDESLPGISGGTVIRRIRLDVVLRNLPCLLITGNTEQEAELRAFNAGADAFVRKDAEVQVVLAKLAALLRQSTETTPIIHGSSTLAPKRILAVDDSITFLHELSMALGREDYEVLLARSGGEALELAATQSIDCILLDLVMPDLDGQETCRRIKDLPSMRDIPIIIMTGRTDQDAMIESLACGADDYVTKTGDFEILQARIRAQIRRKQFEDENRRIREELLRKDHEAAEARTARAIADARAEHTDELRRANEELEAFSYSVSHDLRAPLRSIGGFSTILLEQYHDCLDEQGQDYLQRVCAGVHRMDQLIEALLELSRTARNELRRDRIDLSAIAHAVAEEVHQQQPQRAVTFVIEERLEINADRRLMRTLLDNLIGNAWKFTANTPSPRIEFGLQRTEKDLCYFVRDNGVGFNSRHANRLFEPFRRLHSDTEFPGTGIGLATVRRIVNRHGGRVWAEAAPGLGATIYFTVLPHR
jgi:DNA-binding response OmpR family regulator